MYLTLLGEEVLLGGIGVAELLVAHLPDTIEEGSGEAVDGEYFSASVAEVYEDKHLLL